MTPTVLDWPAIAIDQLDWHWNAALRPRLDGLTDEEYLWEPAPGSWSLRWPADGPATIDWDYPPPTPAPVTTIAWRLTHITLGVFAFRSAGHFGRAAVSYDTWPYARTATEALAQLDEEYARWLAGVRGWAADGSMGDPLGPAEGGFADDPRAALVMHINREAIHHGAEIALLRDLWAHRQT